MNTAGITRLDQLDLRIRAVWFRRQVLNVLAGIFTFIQWLISMFLLAVFIDWMTYMLGVGRWVMLTVVLGVSLTRTWFGGWRDVRPFDAVLTALQLEAYHGDLKSLLVSAIQLRSQPPSSGSTALRDHTCQLAEEAAADLKPGQAVPFKPLLQPGIIVAFLFGVIGIFAVLNSPFLAAGLARIFMPWTTIEYPTNTQITLDHDDLVLKEGDSAEITAKLTGIIPDRATLYVRTGEGKARTIDLDVVNRTSKYNIASASRDFTYRIWAGDDRTAWHKVRVIPAPRIEHVAVELVFPAYFGRKNETMEALTLTVPEGTDLDWNLTLDRPIRSATFVRDGEEPVDLKISDDGLNLAFTADVTASLGYHFTWVDKEHGYDFSSPRYFLQVAADQAPRVEMTLPASNLVAMLGRPLDIAVRVQDDHGIGSAKVAYRINQLDEKMIDLENDIETGQGEQAIDWDYRNELNNLKIGDTVSFTVQISDKYPGEQGPHVARSETRRVTFLSKEQYLEQINKQRDRLLSRVQTIYRQQRLAHDIVRELNPSSEGYLQTCQLEGVRQEMLRDQLREIAHQMQSLLDDLAANGVTDEAQGEAIEFVRSKLNQIAELHIAQAAALLREQSAQAADGNVEEPVDSAAAVNTAARELASLVLLRGIESAQEVYARESRMLAQLQAELRWRTAVNSDSKQMQPLTQSQNDLADWTDQLIHDLQTGMRYEKRPLAVLRLIRSVKNLRESETVEQMRLASDLLNKEQAEQAGAMQARFVKTLLNAEFSVRLSGAYSTLLETRDLIDSMVAVQKKLIADHTALSGAAFAEKREEIARVQNALRKQLLTLMLPEVPAPRANLFDESPPQKPLVDEVLAAADKAMTLALANLDDVDQEAALADQGRAEQALSKLLVFVDRWSLDVGLQSQGLSTLVAATSERIARLEEYEARVISLLDKTDLAAASEKNIDAIAESQKNLASDLGLFIKTLAKQDQIEPDPDLPPLLSQLEAAERLLNQAVESLEKNDAEQAIGQQEQAADTLAEAFAIVVAQNERLSLLQGMLMFQRSVGFANGYLADIVAEQRDLLELTEAAEPEEMKVLLPQFAHMRSCINDVAPLLDLVAARLDVGTPLAFAKTDFEDAIIALETEDKFEAIDAQDVAAESLEKVQLLVQDIRTQAGYLAEIVEFLHESASNAALLSHRQTELRSELIAIEQTDLQRFIKTQHVLVTQAQLQDQKLSTAAGNPKLPPPAEPLIDVNETGNLKPVLNQSAKQMRQAIAALKANDDGTAADHMEMVTLIYAENSESLLTVIKMLCGLPRVEINSDTDPALVRLVDTLALASDHKELFRQTQVASDTAMEAFSEQQSDIAARLNQIASSGESHPLLSAANKHLSDALAVFSPTSREKLRVSQRAAEEKLRHFIIEQALILETDIPPAVASDAPAADGPGSDSESDVTAGFIADFVSGEAPQNQRSEWKVLAERNRAALNQNFARELPLEYRGLLKNYYERVAQ